MKRRPARRPAKKTARRSPRRRVRRPNPARGSARAPLTYDAVATMGAAEINKRLDVLDRESRAITDEFIAAGRGYERPSERRHKTDPLSLRDAQNANDRYVLHAEIARLTGEGLFTDEEITGLLALRGRPCAVAGLLARRKATELAAGGGTVSIGDTSVSEPDASQHWMDFARSIEAWCKASFSMGAIGKRTDGSSWADQPRIFRIGQHDAPHNAVAWTPANDPTRPLAPDWR